MNKTQIAAELATFGLKLTTSQIKKMPLDALRAQLDAAKKVDDSEALTPTPTTNLEKRVLVAYLDAGIDCNGAETLDAMLADNMTWGDTEEIAKRTGLTQKQVQGVQASLSKKGLLVVDCDPVNGEGSVQQVLSDEGIRVAFDLMADGIEAKAKKTEPKPRAPRELEDRIITPVGKLADVKAVTDGSKKHKLAEALLRGTTIEHLMEVLGWNKATVRSALRWDISQMGLGCERKDGKYFLVMPEGLEALPVRTKDVTRKDALVAACK